MLEFTIDEPVCIVPYDLRWPAAFEEVRRELARAIGRDAVPIEHFGSTAVPGLAAKPVIDVLVGFFRYPISAGDAAAFSELGYDGLGEAGVPDRLYFRHRPTAAAPGDGVAVNVAAVAHDGALWRDNVLLRDYLRAHPTEAARYERGKHAAVTAGAIRLLAYSDAKAARVADLLECARAWARQVGA